MTKHPPKPKGRPRKENKDKISNYPERFEFKLTAELKETLLDLGGAAWIREQITEHKKLQSLGLQ